MAIKVLVNGAFGRMGQATVKAVSDHPKLELVGQTSKEYDLKQSIQDARADVVVDFTRAQDAYENTLAIIEAGAHPVIGTTGLSKEQVKTLQERCQTIKRGGLIAPNFSIAAVLMIKYAQEIAAYMTHVEVIEMHHENKKDSPSGTALYTAEKLSKAKHLNPIKNGTTETIHGARGASLGGVPIHSVRLPGFLAHQEIIFGSPGETLTIKHDVIDRSCFMPGVCLACEKVMMLKELAYGLENII